MQTILSMTVSEFRNAVTSTKPDSYDLPLFGIFPADEKLSGNGIASWNLDDYAELKIGLVYNSREQAVCLAGNFGVCDLTKTAKKSEKDSVIEVMVEQYVRKVAGKSPFKPIVGRGCSHRNLAFFSNLDTIPQEAQALPIGWLIGEAYGLANFCSFAYREAGMGIVFLRLISKHH